MLIRIIYWYLNWKFKYLYEDIDKEQIDEWLLEQSLDKRFRDYFKLRDLTILKTIAQGVNQNDYWRLVGQRLELLMLLGKINDISKKSERKKKGAIK